MSLSGVTPDQQNRLHEIALKLVDHLKKTHKQERDVQLFFAQDLKLDLHTLFERDLVAELTSTQSVQFADDLCHRFSLDAQFIALDLCVDYADMYYASGFASLTIDYLSNLIIHIQELNKIYAQLGWHEMVTAFEKAVQAIEGYSSIGKSNREQ